MTNTDATFWEIDNNSLQTLAKNIETRGGNLTAPPNFRGSDTTVPYRAGQVWNEKTPDSRTLSFKMWVRGCDDNGNIPADGTAGRAQYDKNMSQLLRLFWQEGRQYSLRKRFYDDSGILRSASALGEYASGFDASMIGRNASRLSIDVRLANPYFYDDNYTTFNLVNGDNTIILPGHARTANILVNIAGARTNTVVLNKTLNQSVEYHDTLGTGANNVINILNFTSTTTPSGMAAYDSEAMVRHTGSRMWLQLAPGTNIINLSSSSGTGLVSLQAKGAWF